MKKEKKLVAAVLAGMNSSLLLGVAAAVPMAAIMPASVAQAEDSYKLIIVADETKDLGYTNIWESTLVAGTLKGGYYTGSTGMDVTGTVDGLGIGNWGKVTIKDGGQAKNVYVEGFKKEDGSIGEGKLYLGNNAVAENTTVKNLGVMESTGTGVTAKATTVQDGGKLIISSGDMTLEGKNDLKNVTVNSGAKLVMADTTDWNTLAGALNYDVHNTDNLHETYLEWSLGFNGRLSQRTNYYLEYMGTNGDKTKTSYQLNAGFRWNF